MKIRYYYGLVALLPLASASNSQAIVLTEACGPNSNSCRITRTQIDAQTIATRIDQPVVDRAAFDYSTVALGPGDSFTIDASGCVQTGGVGDTWKRYVNPLGSDSDHLYFGLIEIPGVLTQRRVSDVIGQTFTLDAQAPHTFLRLGYPDDQYDDNGYNDHDDGNDNQCSFDNGNDGGPAHLTITIRTQVPIPDPVRPRPEGSVPPTGQPWDLIANLEAHQRAQFDDNLLFFNPRWQWQVPGARMPAFSPDQSSQSVSFDLVSGYKVGICGIGVLLDHGHAVGHANWFDTTVQGNIFWDHHDGGIKGDDDYNVKITTPAITGASSGDPLALVAESNNDIDGFKGTPLVKGEFDSDETVDQDEFNAIPWWRDFHSAVDDSDEAALSGFRNGHPPLAATRRSRS